MRPFECPRDSDDELWARLTSNTPRPPIGKHVLIAGVFGPNNQLLKQLAELQGSTTILTSVGEEALQAAIKDHPDLIIVDVMGSQEFELGRILKGDVRTREIPLIGFSAQDEHLVVAAGYDEFVAKPIGIRNFGLLNFLKLLDRLLLP
jgi:CheY-like chemotaxis protein